MNEKTNILVVDDEEVVCRAYLRALTAAHCNVEAVRDGKGALDVMEQRAFDVVMLDLRMPGLDGMSVLKTIKEKWPQSEVVIITGYPTIETAKEEVRLGAYNYLTKPVGPDDVINVATRAMMQKRWSLQKEQMGPDAAICSSSGSGEAIAVPLRDRLPGRSEVE